MGEIEATGDFTFDTTAPLRIVIESNQADDEQAYRGVEIARMSGHVIYRGYLAPNKPLVFNLGRPLADQELRLKLSSSVDEVERIIPIVDGVAHAEIR